MKPLLPVLPIFSLAAVAAVAASPTTTRTYTMGKTCGIVSCANAALYAGTSRIGTAGYAVTLGNGGYFGNTTFAAASRF